MVDKKLSDFYEGFTATLCVPNLCLVSGEANISRLAPDGFAESLCLT